jgi:hypothetical protein
VHSGLKFQNQLQAPLQIPLSWALRDVGCHSLYLFCLTWQLICEGCLFCCSYVYHYYYYLHTSFMACFCHIYDTFLSLNWKLKGQSSHVSCFSSSVHPLNTNKNK